DVPGAFLHWHADRRHQRPLEAWAFSWRGWLLRDPSWSLRSRWISSVVERRRRSVTLRYFRIRNGRNDTSAFPIRWQAAALKTMMLSEPRALPRHRRTQ